MPQLTSKSLLFSGLNVDDDPAKYVVTANEMMPKRSARVNYRGYEQRPCQRPMNWGKGGAHVHGTCTSDGQRKQKAIQDRVTCLRSPTDVGGKICGQRRRTVNISKADPSYSEGKDEPSAPRVDAMHKEIQRIRSKKRMA
jgi:hypothetical protein